MKIIFKKKNNSSEGPTLSKGFTLIETLVALGIFSASIVSLIVVTGSGISNVTFSKNKITASYLAAEGIELVRNMRDSAVITDSTTGWTNFLNLLSPCVPTSQQLSFFPLIKTAEAQIGSSSFGGSGCDIDAKDPVINQSNVIICSSNGCPLFLDPNNFFTHDSSAPVKTNFSRLITVLEVQPNIEVKIISKVFWQQGGATKSVIMTENLFNWNQPTTP